jgi:hypothetical protein
LHPGIRIAAEAADQDTVTAGIRAIQVDDAVSVAVGNRLWRVAHAHPAQDSLAGEIVAPGVAAPGARAAV